MAVWPSSTATLTTTRREPAGEELDAVRTGVQRQAADHAVEVANLTSEVAVHVDERVRRVSRRASARRWRRPLSTRRHGPSTPLDSLPWCCPNTSWSRTGRAGTACRSVRLQPRRCTPRIGVAVSRSSPRQRVQRRVPTDLVGGPHGWIELHHSLRIAPESMRSDGRDGQRVGAGACATVEGRRRNLCHGRPPRRGANTSADGPVVRAGSGDAVATRGRESFVHLARRQRTALPGLEQSHLRSLVDGGRRAGGCRGRGLRCDRRVVEAAFGRRIPAGAGGARQVRARAAAWSRVTLSEDADREARRTASGERPRQTRPANWTCECVTCAGPSFDAANLMDVGTAGACEKGPPSGLARMCRRQVTGV